MVSTAAAVSASLATSVIETSPTLPAAPSRPGQVLTWTQTFGPQLATAARRHRRRLGRRWYIDEVFLFRGTVKRYPYRAVDSMAG